MNYLDNIKQLIEEDIVLKKKHRLVENNSVLVTNFEIGRLIIEAQGRKERAKYGNELINNWSKILTKEYGKGYDTSNLRRMRQLYLTFENCATLWHNLTWSHLKYILSLKDDNKRNYYINISIKQNLSVRQLKEKLKNNEYERLKYKDNIEIIINDNEITINDMIKKLY